MFFDRWFKKGYSYANTRRFARLPASWSIKCEPKTKENGRHVTQTRDVSAGGAAFVLKEMIPVGARVQLEIHVPPLNRTIQAKGHVVRCVPIPRRGGFDIGIQFDEIPQEDQTALNNAIQEFYKTQPRHRSERPHWWRKLCLPISLLLLWCSPSLGYEPVPDAFDTDELPTRKELPTYEEESDSLREFFRLRTKFGIGFDEAVTDNIFSDTDNLKRHEYISTIEGLVLFIDPRGAVVYGFQHEINAFRYHRLNANAINHQFVSFFDYDPGNRTRFRLDYAFDIRNTLVFGSDDIDIIQRSTDFRRFDSHKAATTFKYALNETNELASVVSYTVVDDRSSNDAQTDRKTLKATLDLDHDLTPIWTIFGGYQFEDNFLPRFKLKSSETHGIRLGVRHELAQDSKLQLLLTFDGIRFHTDQQSTNLDFEGTWTYSLGPRTRMTLSYTDQASTSFEAGRTQFRSRVPSLTLAYELTPLVKLNLDGKYSRQTSDTSDVLSGTAATETKNTQTALGTGLTWRVREAMSITLDHDYSRSKTRDITEHRVLLGFEAEI